MKGGLFGRLLAAMCGVAAASTGLVLAFQGSSLTRDLQHAAEQRLESAAAATERMLQNHFSQVAERYAGVAATPLFRATLEVNDAATLAHYAGELRQQYSAARIAFVQPTGRIVAAAGDAELDAGALAIESGGLFAYAGRAYVAVSTPLGEAGRLVAVEPVATATLALWSELCGARVFLAAGGEGSGEELDRVVRELGGVELRVSASLRSEREAIANARLNLGLAGAVGLAAAFGVSFAFSRALVRPIRQVQAAARRLGGGDLTTAVDTRRSDEIGDVARAFDEMTRELRGTIGHVSEAADRVEATALAIGAGTRRFAAVTSEQRRGGEEAARSAGEIETRVRSIVESARESAQRLDGAVDGSTASFRELAGSGALLEQHVTRLRGQADEIQSSVGQVARSASQVARDTDVLLPAVVSTAERVGQMADAARSVNAHADETARLSGSVVEIAERGRTVVRDAVAGMEATRETIAESERLLLGLKSRGEEIGSILTVIDEVTDQTSLLALNAAIIAAQAGEHGKAFAIVGDEMRALAERVQKSTQEIDAVVRAVQSESADAAASISRGSAQAKAGAQRIRESESSLAEITRAARESGERMAECAQATAVQLDAATAVQREMELVREGVGRIRSATREQADASDVVQRSCAALQDAALAVQDAVGVQTRGTTRIGEVVEAVQRGVRELTGSLEQQVESSRQVAGVVRSSLAHIRSQEASASEIGEAASGLEQQAEALRQAVSRFRT